MFSPNVRLILLAFFLGLAALSVREDPQRALLSVGLALMLGYGALRLGGVPAAFAALRRNDLGVAKKMLGQTKTRFLNPECKAKYAWVEAALAEAAGELELARTKMHAALEGDALPRKAERAIALCTLAAMEQRLGDAAAARANLELASSTSASPDVQRLVAKVREELAS